MSVAIIRRFVVLAVMAAIAMPSLCAAQSADENKRPSPTYTYCSSKLGAPSAAQLGDAKAKRKYDAKFQACLVASGGGTIESEYVDRTRVSQDVEPVGQDPFGEQISLYNGSFSFEQVDIDAQGNGLPIQLIRHFIVPNNAGGLSYYNGHLTANGMVDWRMEIPHLETLSAARGPTGAGSWFFIDDTDRCSAMTTAPEMERNFGTTDPVFWFPEEWWHGYQLMIPGQGSQDVMKRSSNNNLTPATMSVGGQSISFPYTTHSLWAIGCLNSTSNSKPGEGFFAVSPDGTKYWLDHLAAYETRPMTVPGSYHPLNRKWGMMLVSKIQDRFGNTLTYNYTSGTDRLSSITASDGRSLTFTWESWPSRTSLFRIASATLQASDAPDRTYTYDYDDAENPFTPFLKTVSRPDGSTWRFDLSGLQLSSQPVENGLYGAYCAISDTDTYHNIEGTGSITHPSGLVGTFTDQLVTRGRSWVPWECRDPINQISNPSAGYPSYPPLYTVRAITKKQYSGAGISGSRTWNYGYSSPNACYTYHDHLCNAGSPTTVYTDVTDPASHTTRSTFSNRYDVSESLHQSAAVHTGSAASSTLRNTSYAYQHFGNQITPWFWSFQSWVNARQSEALSRQNQRQISQNGNTYTWQATQFNSYAQATRTSRDNNSDTQSVLVETDSYRNDTVQWVLAQPLDHVNVNTGETVRHNVYNTNGTLKERWAFGRKIMSYSWYGNGLLYALTDAKNHTSYLTSYKRGIPRTIQYADSSQKILVVDDLAQIKSVTDEESDTTSYQYDNMGRVTYVGYPYDTGGWDSRNISYTFVPNSERGIYDPHWKRTVSEGDMRSATYYDALWQPILTDTWDVNDSGSHSNVHLDYDYAGRSTFKSYPIGGTPWVTWINQGVTTSCDALGRATTQQQNSELGTLTTSMVYQAGNKRRVTDPKYHVTTTTYQAFDAPTYDAPVRVDFNDGSYTSISRDWYGKPTNMSQHGSWTPAGGFPQSQSVYHYFAYDSYHRLCKQTSPETGQTGYSYDAADNLYRTAQGLSGSTYSCPASWPYGQTVYRSYDARNRLTGINYPSGTPDSSFTWYADGKPHTATRGASTWTLNWYNRGLLKNETLAIDSYSFQLAYGYDSSGHRNTISYPSGMQLSLNPDGLGRPTQLGSWAYNLSWDPSGRPSSITYGNGGYFSESLKNRDLVSGTAYSLGGQQLTNRTLTWDKNGNPASITDAVATSSVNMLKPAQSDWLSKSPFAASPFLNSVNSMTTYSAGTGNRSFTYDSLDRLTKLYASRYGNDRYTYDALGNVRSRTFGSTSTYSYDSTHNRISSMPGTGSFSYDDRGNVTQVGTFAVTRNRANEMTNDALGSSFAYDARGWRVKKYVTAGGTHTYYFVYDSNHRLMERWDNGIRTDFVYLGKKPIARITSNNPTYIFTDYQNSPLFETNSAGTVTRAPDFVGYAHPDTSGIAEIPGYTGAAPDSETGLLYLGARYLFAERFLSPDPAPLDPTSPVGLNRYAYANDNPVRYTDPDGRQAKENCDEACQIKQQYERDFGRQSKLSHSAKAVADGASTTGDVIEIAYETAVLPTVKLGILGRVGRWFSRLVKPAQKEVAAFPKGASQIGHIFRDAPGHLPDTAASRKLLSEVASNPSNKVGVDRFGNTWAASTRADGTQVWVSTRNGVIQNGGLNEVPTTKFPIINEP